MTSELIILFNCSKDVEDDGIVLVKDRYYHRWKKKDLRKFAEKGYVCGYLSGSLDDYFVIPMNQVKCLTICEGSSSSVRKAPEDDDIELEDEIYKGAKPNPDERMFG